MKKGKKSAGRMAFRPFIALSAMHLAIENFFSVMIWKIKNRASKTSPCFALIHESE